MKGILDRFEDNDIAVILVEEINEEMIVSKDKLPEGSDVNTYFHIEKRNGKLEIISIDTSSRKKEAQQSSDLMKKLRAKSSGGKFRKK
ncbi:DUF3006 domain-containing protein [Virgibacillus sp. C22-A2]|uniref:DUF3006 domain-containing protein n=1 Tax=Virgibacillus tibetensis TaxID=3042313 RepID=A0ABU6KDH4_9BACI|nr:DUF3006 domain-containing protein [Virgibacillus sp. C22-A2]